MPRRRAFSSASACVRRIASRRNGLSGGGRNSPFETGPNLIGERLVVVHRSRSWHAAATFPRVPEPDETGESAVQRLRRTGAARLAEMLQRDPALRARAVEFGLVRPEWIDRPDEEQMLGAKPIDVVERFLAREVDVRPSTLERARALGDPDPGGRKRPRRVRGRRRRSHGRVHRPRRVQQLYRA